MLTGYWAEAPARPARLASIAAATGLSIFLETESGIVMMVAAPMTIFLIHPWRSYIILPICAFVADIARCLCGNALCRVWFGGIPDSNSSVACSTASFFTEPPASARGPRIGPLANGTGSTISSLPAHRWRRWRSSPGPPIWMSFDKRRMAVLGFLAVSGLMLLAKYREHVARRGLANELDRAVQRSGMVVHRAHSPYRSRQDRAGRLCRLAARHADRRPFAVGASASIRCAA